MLILTPNSDGRLCARLEEIEADVIPSCHLAIIAGRMTEVVTTRGGSGSGGRRCIKRL